MRPFFTGFTLRLIASGVIGLALVSGAASSALAQHAALAASASQAVQMPHGGPIKGSYRSGVVNLDTLAPSSPAQIQAAAASAAPALHPLQPPTQQAAYRRWALTHPGALPKATGAPAPKAANTYGNGALPVLVSEHEGLSSTDAGGAYPPDPALTVAPGYMFEGVNNVMAVYTWNYARKYGPWTPAQVFTSVKHANATFLAPQITFDAERHVYLIVWLEITTSDNVHYNDYLDIAISKTSTPSPLANFRVYQVPATVFGADVYCDYPTLGYDYWGMYVTCMSYSVSGGSWTGNDTLALSLNKLLDGTGPTGWAWGSVYTDVSCGTSCFNPAYRISPTIEDGVPQAEWVTAVDAGFGVVSSTQIVCAITNTIALNAGASPTFTCVRTTLPLPYADPGDATQPSPSLPIHLSVGYKQVAYRNGQLYFAFTSLTNCSGNTQNGIYWAAITPQLTTIAAHSPQWSNGVISAYSQAGEFCYSDADAYMPTLIADTEGDMTLLYNYSSAIAYPSIGYTGRTAADYPSQIGQVIWWSTVITGSHSNNTGRWGDYATCALSANLVTRGIVFCANEFMGAATSPGWDTELYEIRME